MWQSNAIPRRPPPIWQFSVVNHSGSMAAANLPTVRRWIGETSFLQVPHKAIDNFFHFHNNFLVPLMLNVLLSGSESVPRRLFLFKTWPPEFQVESKSAARFGLSGLPRTKKTGEWPFNATHPSFFYTLHKLFAEVKWPVDELWEDGQALCFRRLVWSQMLTPSRYPYFDYAPTEQLYRRHSVPNRVRDMIRSAIGLRMPPPRDTLANMDLAAGDLRRGEWHRPLRAQPEGGDWHAAGLGPLWHRPRPRRLCKAFGAIIARHAAEAAFKAVAGDGCAHWRARRRYGAHHLPQCVECGRRAARSLLVRAAHDPHLQGDGAAAGLRLPLGGRAPATSHVDG